MVFPRIVVARPAVHRVCVVYKSCFYTFFGFLQPFLLQGRSVSDPSPQLPCSTDSSPQGCRALLDLPLPFTWSRAESKLHIDLLVLRCERNLAHLLNFGTIQRRLAWPSRRDVTHKREALKAVFFAPRGFRSYFRFPISIDLFGQLHGGVVHH